MMRDDHVKDWPFGKTSIGNSVTPGALPSTTNGPILKPMMCDATAVPWFQSPLVSVPPPCGGRLEMTLGPNPARGAVTILLRAPAARAWRLDVLDLSGRRVRDLASGDGSEGALACGWDGRDGSGARVRAGVYWVRLSGAGASATRRVVLFAAD